jgi:hypothetical protein
MRQRQSSGQVVVLVVGLMGLLASACSSPGSERIVGPDGSAMSHVHCGSLQGECFRIAGELCPGGYEMQPVLSGSDGNFLVRCRVGGAQAVATQCAAPAAAPAHAVATVPAAPHTEAAAVASKEHWPPATEPWPAAYPWPPPETSTAVRAPSPTPKTPQGDVDIGY